MAYRYQKNNNGEQDLIIDGFEKGIADSPFVGIGNIRNLNVKYYEGVAYVNYKRKACTITGATMALPRYACKGNTGIIYISDENGNIFKQTAINGSTFAALTGLSGGASVGLQFWNNYLLAWASDSLNICGDGTGDGGVTSGNWNTAAGINGVWPIKNATLTLTGTPGFGASSAAISTYTDAKGNARAFWNGPPGSYEILFDGVTSPVIASMVQGEASFSFYPALPNGAASSSATIRPIRTVLQGHNSLVSINDGDMYFCNNSNIGSLNLLAYQTFDKSKMDGSNFTFNVAALSLPTAETAICLTELQNILLIGVYFKIYPWDRSSPEWQNPIPMQEQINSMINILNNVYVLAGNKGNIYITNNTQARKFKKLPDYIGGVIDPVWSWMALGSGGLMGHRLKLWFMVLASNSQTGVPILEGIFSLDLDTNILNMEAQNSFGLSSATTTANGLLIDNNSIALNYDNYYSAWGNGAADAGGIDFNDTTLWSSNEPVIETDIIPIGTSAQQKTFSSIEFKLDQPLQSGDSISVYARQSLSDTYQQIGLTTTSSTVTPSGTTISDFLQPIPFEKWQWIQFKITMSCNATATNSSFIRLREIRIR